MSRKGAGVGFTFYGTLEGKNIPEEYKPLLRQLIAERNRGPYIHDAPPNQELIQMAKDLGLYDWLRERSGVLDGTAEDMREGIQQLHDRGIHNLMILPGIGMDKGDYARLLGKEVLPHFS